MVYFANKAFGTWRIFEERYHYAAKIIEEEQDFLRLQFCISGEHIYVVQLQAD